MKLVSAIMLTRGRPVFARLAVECFLAQTYAAKELIVLDDAEERSFPQGISAIDAPQVTYATSSERLIYRKRNAACGLAHGEILCHFDDDDWSGPDRISQQLERMERSGKEVTGYHSMLFHVQQSGQFVKYVNDSSYALGTSLMFTRGFWQQHPFRAGQDLPNIGEDNAFVKDAREAHQLASVDAESMMVARAHAGNTSVKVLATPGSLSYREVQIAVPAGFVEMPA